MDKLVQPVQENPLFFLVLAVLGSLSIFNVVSVCTNFVYNAFVRSGKNVTKLGEWAVVTGATDGIGKAVAFELAKKGINLMLVSRTAAKLQEAKEEIKGKYPNVEIKMVPYDFAKAGKVDFDNLKEEVDKLEVGLLYNNVGVSYDHAEKISDITDEKVDAIIEVNNRQLVKMTRMVLPQMLARKRGAIVNIGSAEGCIPAPFYVLYGASKAFVEWFTKDLAGELKGCGVSVQAHIPNFVATKMAIPNEKRRKGSFFCPWPSTWAKASLAAIGTTPIVYPYWPHALQLGALQMLPWGLQEYIRYGMSAKIRAIALKKKAAANKGQ